MSGETVSGNSLPSGRRPPPCAMVIFGASGDLTRRKLMPALYRLSSTGRLPPSFAVIGTSRTPMSAEQFREKIRESTTQHLEDVSLDGEAWNEFARSLFYLPGDAYDPESFARLRGKLEELERQCQTGGNVLFYLATQPSHYGAIAEGLGRTGLARGSGWRRLVIEKPFGRDLASARELHRSLHSAFEEEQIYRIDHYLGKETVRNILAFRFSNGIFEPLWNRHYINHVQITAAEAIGVEGRGAFYEQTGALRDMVQNHLLQVMATVTIEPYTVFDAKAVRDEKVKLLRSIRLWKPEEAAANAVAGQYVAARVDSTDIPGFRQERGVDPNSRTETYAAVTLFVDNWRWKGVPFYIRTGKRLAKRVTQVAIQFHCAPHAPFPGACPEQAHERVPNLLVLRIQPEEGISLRFLSKEPGPGMTLRPVSMDFNYHANFGVEPSAYETLLIDVMEGDSTLFIRQDGVEASWAAVQPFLDAWADGPEPLPYAAGTWGPAAADQMLARRGHSWRNP